MLLGCSYYHALFGHGRAPQLIPRPKPRVYLDAMRVVMQYPERFVGLFDGIKRGNEQAVAPFSLSVSLLHPDHPAQLLVRLELLNQSVRIVRSRFVVLDPSGDAVE